ncbi:peroxisomal targeting signal 1 receptor-like isoform X2 [Halichondria panicea]|uniref:peroxisomal targeting signal 1 receptor-like isoform X2 n=1 Tax=Halichondria panicea TaxID=6063 RepID=UPI00312BCB13
MAGSGLRPLVESECGAANPLVQWTSHFTQQKSMLQGGLDGDRLTEVTGLVGGGETAQQLVGEFLGESRVPQTFRMSSLLHRAQAPPDTSTVGEWVTEFSHPQPPPTLESSWIREFESSRTSEEQRWVEEFQQTSVQSVAKEMTNTVTDPDIQATEFMDFVRSMASGEVPATKQEDWSEQFERGASNGGFWSELEKEWTDLSREQESHPWLSEFSQPLTDYSFTPDNPLLDVSDPLAEGLKRRKEGDLPSAVLLFEAEVQARPDSVQGWLYLGSTQADNEQDLPAIAALHKCLCLEPGHLEAHQALAVSYTNESQQNKVHTHSVLRMPGIEAVLHFSSQPVLILKALDALRAWIQHNPKYAHLHSPQQDKPFTGSFMTREEHGRVKDLYLAAAQSSPDEMDYHVQVGLGVLFNLSQEYDKAVDCFSAALDTRPDDAMLWNKLGATLANGNRSEEAVAAYRKALEIIPGFTRCRYNLGVSCINLGAYKEAVEHLLTALNIQREAKGPQGSRPVMSESVWSTLRLAVTFLGSTTERLALVEQRDLNGLIAEFGL